MSEIEHRHQVQQLVLEKEEAIESQYNVSLSRPGEEGPKQVDVVNASSDGKTLRTRATTLSELTALEQALNVSATSLPTKNEAPLTILFLDEQPTLNGTLDAGGSYNELTHPMRITINDKPTADFERSKEIFTHELAHQAQHKLWKSTHAMPYETASSMGWGLGIVGTDPSNFLSLSLRLPLSFILPLFVQHPFATTLGLTAGERAISRIHLIGFFVFLLGS
jgi:hypothetical protein